MATDQDELTSGYRWLGHEGRGYTEVAFVHLDYRPGETSWNRAHDSFPETGYVRSSEEFLGFLSSPDERRMYLYGANPRTDAPRNSYGYPRPSRNDEIEISQTLLLDLDVQEPNALGELERFLMGKGEEFFRDQGLRTPEMAFTGGGFHLLLAYPPIRVAEYPELPRLLRTFRNQYARAYRSEMSRLETEVDQTQDLRRMIRVYGTAKPTVGIKSELRARERIEDASFRDYLLGLEPSDHSEGKITPRPLPNWFSELLEEDERLAQFWAGRGKRRGDRSRSGYDFTVIQRLLSLGYTDLEDLAAILAARPNGVVRQRQKGDEYVGRTITNAWLHYNRNR